jgi:hypothetical protein
VRCEHAAPVGKMAAGFHSNANISLGCLQAAPLFHPLSCRSFSSDIFERFHHVTRATGLAAVLRSPELDALSQRWQFKIAEDHSQARVLHPESFSHDEAYAPGSVLDGAAIRRALLANRSVVLHNMELYHRPIGLLALALMRAFGVYSQANVYYSPTGLPSAVHAHQDAQSVFIVQCEGAKQWELFMPPQRWRLRYNQRGKGGDVAPQSELQEPVGTPITLTPGDVLFVPRAMYHRTSTLVERGPSDTGSTASLHVTIGVETDTDGLTWLALLKDAAAALKLPEAAERLDAAQWVNERLREALPLPLCRPGGSFDASEPHAAAWLARARELLGPHVDTRPESSALRHALDGALRKRHELIEAKRQQLVDFMALS